MKRMMWMILLVATMVWLPSWHRHTPLSERIVAGGVGMDVRPNGVDLSLQSMGEETESVTLAGDTLGDAVSAASDRLGRSLELRQNQLLCLGENTAQTNDLSYLSEYWLRSGNGRLTAYLAICRGTAAEWMSTASVIDAVDVIERSAVRGQGVRYRLLDAMRSVFENGDALVPILAVQNGQTVTDGAWLFHHGRRVAELTSSQIGGVTLLTEKVQGVTVVCQTPNGIATVELSDLSHRIAVTETQGKWRFTVSVTARAAVLENGDGISPERLSAAASQTVTAQVNDAVQHTAKRYGCDVCGWVNAVKTQLPFATPATREEWERQLQSADYDVFVSVAVTATGLRH